ncbi:MAG: sigma-E processing peptidase SpoIIGA [Clostridia bacterium]|nr:sigma-E processing peptidase SpoIIGA [Clostridia bacterium]
MKTVYTELFILDNLLINYYLLYLCGRVIKKDINKQNGVFAALFGALYSLLALGYFSFLSSVVFKAAVSFLMVYISYKPDKALYIRLVISFYALSFGFGGLLFALLYAAKTDRALKAVMYLPLPFRLLLLMLCFGQLFKKRFLGFISSIKYCRQDIFLTVFGLEREFTLSCLSDTGNYCEYMGRPVAFVNANEIEKSEVIECAVKGNIYKGGLNIHIVYIPFKTVKGEVKTAPGFKCERAVLTCGETKKELCLYIALVDRDFNGKSCLINPSILD